MSPGSADPEPSRPGGELATRITAARQSGPLTARLLNLLAMLAPRPIAVERLEGQIVRRPPTSATPGGRGLDLEGVVRRLIELELLRGEVDGSRVHMPEHVQTAVRDELPHAVAAGALTAALGLIRDGLQGGGRGGGRLPHRELMPHAVVVAERTAEMGRAPDGALALAGRLLAGAASEGVDGELLAAAERLQGVAEGSSVLEDPFLRAALGDQHADLLAAAGESDEACRRAEAAIRDAEAVLAREDDPRLALLHYNTGGLYKGAGRPEEGILHFRRARRILEMDASDESGLAARVLVDLAECLLLADRLEAAREIAPRAVDACAERFGPDHPETTAARRAARRARERTEGEPARSTPESG